MINKLITLEKYKFEYKLKNKLLPQKHKSFVT